MEHGREVRLHPTRDMLKLYVYRALEDNSISDDVTEHLRECELCAEFVQEYREQCELIDEAYAEPLSDETLEFARTLFGRPAAGAIIQLSFAEADKPASLRLAADGRSSRPNVVNLVTLFSEKPEVVLNVMRDVSKDIDYLQLIANDPALSSHVMIQIPELGREFITDDDGRAVIEQPRIENFNKLKWQIKMPDAVFALMPLTYDPERVEYSEEVILTTQKQDKIKVMFEGRELGKRIVIQILELEGKADFGKIRVAIAQNGVAKTSFVSRGETVLFDLVNSESRVNIRLFQ